MYPNRTVLTNLVGRPGSTVRTVHIDPGTRVPDHAAQPNQLRPKDEPDHAALAAECIRMGKIRRGELPPDPKPIDARAQFIIDSAAKARGEQDND